MTERIFPHNPSPYQVGQCFQIQGPDGPEEVIVENVLYVGSRIDVTVYNKFRNTKETWSFFE
jgi:hypothetical protein